MVNILRYIREISWGGGQTMSSTVQDNYQHI